jgi:hypothetical protein
MQEWKERNKKREKPIIPETPKRDFVACKLS